MDREGRDLKGILQFIRRSVFYYILIRRVTYLNIGMGCRPPPVFQNHASTIS
jgi:hypothetical protein